MGLELEELTGSVIGAAIKVDKPLGPGFLEPSQPSKSGASVPPNGHTITSRLPDFLTSLEAPFSVGHPSPFHRHLPWGSR
jgi:hypothetical protein